MLRRRDSFTLAACTPTSKARIEMRGAPVAWRCWRSMAIVRLRVYTPHAEAGTCTDQSVARTATCFIHIAALVMTAIMVYHIRSKYTAVGECCCEAERAARLQSRRESRREEQSRTADRQRRCSTLRAAC
jgi:hypothetical protein